MKKLALVTSALALLATLHIAGAANQNTKPAKAKSAKPAASEAGCCGGC
jgi:hypothetical protein